MQLNNTELALIEIIREAQFGSIVNFRLTNGQPIIDKNTEVIAEYKLSGVEAKHESPAMEDYLKKPQVRTMLERFRSIGDGNIECLDIRNGLPFKMTVKRKALI